MSWDRPLFTESYWQIGFNEGYAGKEITLPNPTMSEKWFRPNEGYLNGYRFGKEKKLKEAS